MLSRILFAFRNAGSSLAGLRERYVLYYQWRCAVGAVRGGHMSHFRLRPLLRQAGQWRLAWKDDFRAPLPSPLLPAAGMVGLVGLLCLAAGTSLPLLPALAFLLAKVVTYGL